MDYYDSAQDTKQHIAAVAANINEIIFRLSKRALKHDTSKLYPPEKPLFDEHTPKLNSLTYGSDAYKQSIQDLGVALEHHYQKNDHHPEHFENGIEDMNIIQLLEMLCDWKAAVERHDDGDLVLSLTHNKKRFGISDELMRLLIRQCIAMDWFDIKWYDYPSMDTTYVYEYILTDGANAGKA